MPFAQPKKIMILAGEASGDLLASQLCQAIKNKLPDVDLFGMGSKLMQQTGVELLVDADEIAVVGQVEVLKHIFKIRRAFKTIKESMLKRKPDLVILVDYPGFNLRIAKFAKKLGFKVFFYVSPQIWAWRYHRIHFIRKHIDKMAVLFAFEKTMYQKENMPVTFVGHPLVDSAIPNMDRVTAFETFKLDPNKPVITLFPGSRKQEVSRMLPTILSALPKIHESIPDAQFVLPLASSLTRADIKLPINSNIKIIEDNTYNLLSISRAAIAVSGTVTLEIGLQNVPLVIIYKLSPLSFWIAKRLVKTKYIGLCNIVAETDAAKELIQHEANADTIAKETIRLLTDQPYREQAIEKMNVMQKNLGNGGGAERTATAALELIMDPMIKS